MNDMSRMLDETLAQARVVKSSIDDALAKNDKLREALDVARCYVEAFADTDSSGESAADLALIDEALAQN